MSVIYLDHHATTPLDPRVLAVVYEALSNQYGNAGSVTHVLGQSAREAAEGARTAIANCLGTDPNHLVFTSGATESNNLAIRGVFEHPRCRGRHAISMTTEHRSVLDPLRRLERRGVEVSWLAPTLAGSARAGILDLDRLHDAIRPETALVSIMWANNEIGTIQPVAEIAKACRERGAFFHCDATQAVGKVPIRLSTLGIDFLSLSAHKFYGPKGVGALIVDRQRVGNRFQAQIDGGGQEFGLRSGTLNVPGILGMAAAVRIAHDELPGEAHRLGELQLRLAEQLRIALPDLMVNGPELTNRECRLPGNLNLALPNVDAHSLMLHVPEVCVTTGSACSSATPEPSHVLQALGHDPDHIRCSLRFGLGRFNTAAEIDRAADLLGQAASQLRSR